ncbi:hypothetical protein WDW86_15720 [Bdellovibrionota bacterium FG-2]
MTKHDDDEDATEQKRLALALDEASLNYLEARVQFYRKKTCHEPLHEIDAKRARLHDHLLKCFKAYIKDFDGDISGIPKADSDRVVIGNWAMKHALKLLCR